MKAESEAVRCHRMANCWAKGEHWQRNGCTEEEWQALAALIPTRSDWAFEPKGETALA